MRYTSVLVVMVGVTGLFLAGQARSYAETTSAGIASAKGKTSTTRPSVRERLLKRRAASQPAKGTSQPAASHPAKVTTRPSSPAVIVYYFHRTLRCPTCIKLEELAKQAVESGFAKEIALGTVQWRTANIQQNGNEHFEKDYKLEGPSLILVKIKNGEQVEWQNMDKIWELVSTPVEYAKYVQGGLRHYLH